MISQWSSHLGVMDWNAHDGSTGSMYRLPFFVPPDVWLFWADAYHPRLILMASDSHGWRRHCASQSWRSNSQVEHKIARKSCSQASGHIMDMKPSNILQ